MILCRPPQIRKVTTILHFSFCIKYCIPLIVQSINLWSILVKSFGTSFSDRKPTNKLNSARLHISFSPTLELYHLCNPKLAQTWKWLACGLPRNCNIFIHHSFRHESSTNEGTADFRFKPANKPTSLFTATIVFYESPPTISFAEMTNYQRFVNHLRAIIFSTLYPYDTTGLNFSTMSEKKWQLMPLL